MTLLDSITDSILLFDFMRTGWSKISDSLACFIFYFVEFKLAGYSPLPEKLKLEDFWCLLLVEVVYVPFTFIARGLLLLYCYILDYTPITFFFELYSVVRSFLASANYYFNWLGVWICSKTDPLLSLIERSSKFR